MPLPSLNLPPDDLARLRSTFGLGAPGAPPPARKANADEEERRRQWAMHRFDGSDRMLVPHTEQFASRYGAGLNAYYTRFDEALRDNWHNALAMRRSAFIEELLQHRMMPVVGLQWHIEVDDPKDPDQKTIADRVTKLIEAIPRFQMLRWYLSEAIWQGKYGAQVQWREVEIDGRKQVTIVDHEPVDGDSIVYKYDKTPGILVRGDWEAPEGDRHRVEDPHKPWIGQVDRARALFLYDPFWRDRFIIQNFRPSSADFLFEGDKAAGIFGVGLRSRLYWDFQLREELRTWRSDALQRIGVNGMLYGFYESGNPASMAQVINSLRLIIRDNVTAFPVEKDTPPQEIRHIEPSQVGYDVIAACITELEETMRRAVLGQSLSSEAQATGLGSAVADLHKSTFEHIIKCDAVNQQETLTHDLIKPMIRFNKWDYRGQVLDGELPFRVRFIYQIEKADVKDRAQAIETGYNLGLELDKEAVYADLGLSAPKDPANVLKKPEGAPPIGGGAGGAAPQPGQNGHGNGNGAPRVIPGGFPAFKVTKHPDTGGFRIHGVHHPNGLPRIPEMAT